MSTPDDPQRSTVCARSSAVPASTTAPLSSPIQLSSVFRIDDLRQIDALYEGEEAAYTYARHRHPNATELAVKIAALEGAPPAVVCASGMAAESAVFLALLGPAAEI